MRLPGLLVLVCSVVQAETLRTVAPADCAPHAADHTFLWWANGWDQGAPRQPAILCIQSGRYGLALDVGKPQLITLGEFAPSLPYAATGGGGSDAVFQLPKARLELSVTIGPTLYRCVCAATNQKDWLNFPVRIIESGRFLQRCDILQLEFADAQGNRLEADGRLEITAWPDRLNLLLELVPFRDLPDGSLEVAIERTERGTAKRNEVGTHVTLRSGTRQSASLVVWFGTAEPSAPNADAVKVENLNQGSAALPVSYDAARGWHRVRLPDWRWSVANEPDRLERFQVTLKNPSPAEQVVRLLFDAEGGIPGITGFTPLLRDRNGFPTGIPVQLSKNWHRQKDQRMLYEGPWFHGFILLRLPPQSVLPCEFNVTWARWGGVPAASHAQLCLIGWGWNQLWDEVAIGSWGESICYEPDAVQQRCRIDDVRPLMVWAMSGEKQKWTWTHNVGGGDFLVYYNTQGQYQPLCGVRTTYLAHGPNLTEATYAGISADGHIASRIRVSSPRCDDINRAYHRLRYDVLKPTPFTRLAFYQLGADRYHWHQYNRMARGDESGLLEEWKPNRGGKKYDRSGMRCDGKVPWFSLHDAIPQDNLKPVTGAWANRGLVIRSWKARLGGQEAPPVASVYGTEAGGIPSANLELSAPSGLARLLPGDFVEAEIELVIIPMFADDYYGPNENLRTSLRANANTWKPVHQQAIGNHLRLRVIHGQVLYPYPVKARVDGRQMAELEITGGVGYVPITFSGLTDYKGYALSMSLAGKSERVDQSVHGHDYWQTDYDPALKQWSITYNLPLDSPGDSPRTVRLVFRRQQ